MKKLQNTRSLRTNAQFLPTTLLTAVCGGTDETKPAKWFTTIMKPTGDDPK